MDFFSIAAHQHPNTARELAMSISPWDIHTALDLMKYCNTYQISTSISVLTHFFLAIWSYIVRVSLYTVTDLAW